jgi:ribosomal protein S18 acetylase RimI-like enzyme
MLADYDIRDARVEDIPRLVEFRKKITEHSRDANSDFPLRSESAWAELPEQYERWIGDDRVCFLVAQHRESARVVAMVIGHYIETDRLEPGHFGEISDAWVEPEHRRNGVGRRLVHHVGEFFVDAGAARVQLDFAAGNTEAESFWLGFGLRPMLMALSGDPSEFLEATAPDGRDEEAGSES